MLANIVLLQPQLPQPVIVVVDTFVFKVRLNQIPQMVLLVEHVLRDTIVQMVPLLNNFVQRITTVLAVLVHRMAYAMRATSVVPVSLNLMLMHVQLAHIAMALLPVYNIVHLELFRMSSMLHPHQRASYVLHRDIVILLV